MKLGIIMNTSNPETAWNGLRLGNEALRGGNPTSLFLLGSGGNLLACGTCLEERHQAAGVCPVSTMSELVAMISDSDKLVTFG